MPQDNSVTMYDVKLIFLNFSGAPTKFNPEGGKRNFGVLLPEKVADDLTSMGWNVKYLEPHKDDEDGVRQPWLPVEASYKIRPPRVVLITDRGRTNLDESTISELDSADIKMVDMSVNPSNYDVNGKTGIKAYLRAIYVTIEEDELAKKYAEMDSA